MVSTKCGRDSQTRCTLPLDVRWRLRAPADSCGDQFPAHAHFLGTGAYCDFLRRMDYRAAVAGFSRDSRGRKTDAFLGGANPQLVRQNSCSNRWAVITARGASACDYSLVTAPQAFRTLRVGDPKSR